MLTIRRASERGFASHGWLESFHTFSFGDYHDPRHMGFRGLRVINDDTVAPGRGFGTHGHRDMEIISYVLDGQLEHKDSTGSGSVLRPGDVQRMSAGTGIRHSEFNGSSTDPVHFLQIWIQPDQLGIAPGYEEKHFSEEERQGQLRLLASPTSEDGSLRLHAAVKIYATLLRTGEQVAHSVLDQRHAWVHVARGHVRVREHELNTGDAASTSDTGLLTLQALSDCEVLILDLA